MTTRPLLLAAALALVPAAAQTPGFPGPPGGPSTPGFPSAPGGVAPPGFPGAPAQPVPLDGGLGLLALAGGAYAVQRLRRR